MCVPSCLRPVFFLCLVGMLCAASETANAAAASHDVLGLWCCALGTVSYNGKDVTGTPQRSVLPRIVAPQPVLDGTLYVLTTVNCFGIMVAGGIGNSVKFAVTPAKQKQNQQKQQQRQQQRQTNDLLR